MFFDMPKLVAAADKLLQELTNPLHRRIIENYRRHAMLEVSGRWEEIFTPEMTVEHPRYVVHNAQGMSVLDGYEAVAGFYTSYVESESTVILLENEKLLVGDWGFASEATSHRLWRGEDLKAQGEPIVDLDAWYIATTTTGMFWPYTSDGRMIGEHVYRGGDRAIRKAPPEDVITRAEVARVLEPFITPMGTYSEALT